MVDQPPEAAEAPEASEAEEEKESKGSRLRWLLGLFMSLLYPQRPNVYIRPTDPVLTPRDLWLQYMKKNIKRHALYALSFTWLFGLILMPNHTDYNDAAEARERIVQAYEMKAVPESQRAEGRRELSKVFLKSRSFKARTDIDVGGDTPDRLHEIVLKVAQSSLTGQPVMLDTHKRGNGFLGALMYYVLAYLLLFHLSLSVRYYTSSYVKGEYIADLPWLRGWPLLFALLVTPWLLPAYVGSAIRLAFYKRIKRKAAQADEQAPYHFPVDMDAAREFYFQLRLDEWHKHTAARLAQIEAMLEELAAFARARQQERSLLLAEQGNLGRIDITTEAPASDDVATEFEALLADKRIKGLTRVDDQLQVYVEARYRLDGVLYDLGDWVLAVDISGLSSLEVRTGTKVKWHVYAHPIYRLRDRVFCFGPTTLEIARLLEKGLIARAILLAVESLNSINEDDFPNVPKAFHVIPEE